MMNKFSRKLQDDDEKLGRFFLGDPQDHEDPRPIRSSRGKVRNGQWASSQPDDVTPRPNGSRLNRHLAAITRWTVVAIIGIMATVLALIVLLRWAMVPTSAFMLRQKLEGKHTAYQWVDGSKISPYMAIAVVAAEDQRFPDHWGFDLEAISDALRENRRRSRPRGASTITQQVAKNLFLWPGRNFLRKGLEAGLTMAIELCWSKQRILEVYLNIAQFGPTTFGVAAASRNFFHKRPDKITPYEAALLAAVLPNPRDYSLAPPSPYVRQRAADIQEQISLLGGPAYLRNLE